MTTFVTPSVKEFEKIAICFISNISDIWPADLPQILENWCYKKNNISRTKKLTQYCNSAITLPLSSYEQSSSIFRQSSPFCKVFAKVFLKWYPPFLSITAIYISMDPLFRSLLISPWPEEWVLNWVHTLSGTESFHKKFSFGTFRYKNWRKLLWLGLKSKLQSFFTNYFWKSN